MTFIVNTEEETIALGKKIGKNLKKQDIVAVDGTLAAGKTYLTKGIAQGLLIEDEITSPTFTLINEYNGRLPLYHMDVYRLDSTEEFLNLGVEEILYGNGVCVIEWSEKVREVLPPSTINISIKVNDDNSRVISIENMNIS